MAHLNQVTTTFLKVLIMMSVLIACSESFQSSINIDTDVVLYSKVDASSECSSSACNHTCIHRTKFPAYTDGLARMGDDCLAVDSSDLPTATNKSAQNVHFSDKNNCSQVEMKVYTSPGGSFSLSFWVKANFETNYTMILMQYKPISIVLLERNLDVIVNKNVSRINNFSSTTWNHLVIRFSDAVEVLINGDFEAGGTQYKSQENTVDIGPRKEDLGDGDFLSIADVRSYPDILTDREIKALYKGQATLETLRIQTECRCPPDAPSVMDNSNIWCTNSVGNVTVRRVNSAGGYTDFVNDNDKFIGWKSDGNVRSADVTVDLQNAFQMDKVAVFGLEPNNIGLMVQLHFQGQLTQELTFTDNDCGSLTNCHDLADINGAFFELDDSSVSNKEELSKLLADTVVIKMTSDISTQFAIGEIQFHVRCHCSGNDRSCSINGTDYTCSCTSNTKGDHCENCVQDFYKETEEEFTCIHPCKCDLKGSVDNTCNQVGGQCSCKSNVNESASRTCNVCNFNTVNLGTDDDKGCISCPCNLEGIRNCKMDQTCVCKDNIENVTGHCDSCIPGFYGIHLSEGCLPCECDERGTNNQKIGQCDHHTGQCDCKTNVTGRRCGECKDGLYNLRSDSVTGCEELCNCSFVGSVSNMCEIESGSCSCLDSIQPSRQCLPEIISVKPLYGPIAGGTVISIQGVLLGKRETSSLTFSIDRKSQNITFWNSSLIVIETSPNSGVKQSHAALEWTQGSLSYRPEDFDTRIFEYKPNPVLQTSQKFYTYASGGCPLRIAGSNLNSTYLPRMVFHTNIEDTFTDCDSISDAEMICSTPNVLQYNLTGKTSFGFIFDGFKSYETIDDDTGKMTVLQEPIIRGFTETFGNTFDTEIEITGERLNSACVDNLTVLIGEKQCDIRSVSESSIVCKPDEPFPGTSREETLVVMFGYFKLEPGKITFKDFWHTQEFLYIAIGVGCLLVIISMILVGVCVHRRRKRLNVQRNSEMMDLVQKPPENRAQPNEYLQGGVNPAIVSITTDLKDSNAENIIKDFMDRVRADIRKVLKSSVIDRGNIKPGKICTRKGTKTRVIDGTFSAKSGIAGQRIMIKTLVTPYSESGEIPEWLQKGLLESTRFRDYIHDNVLQCRGVSVDEKQVYVLYPEMSKRTLKDCLTSATEPFTEEKRLDICIQVAEGMNYLDVHNIVHKDLAARNCWVNSEHVVKVSDGSFTPDLYPDEYLYKTGSYLPVRWMAPESLKQLGFYHSKSDVWSYGVLMWEVFTNGYLPYHDITDAEQIGEFVCNQGYRLGKPYECSDEAFSVIKSCHTEQSEERLNFFIVINHLTEIISPTQPVGYVNQSDLEDQIYENTPRPKRR